MSHSYHTCGFVSGSVSEHVLPEVPNDEAKLVIYGQQ